MKKDNSSLISRTCNNLKSADFKASWSLSENKISISYEDGLDPKVNFLLLAALKTGYFLGILDKEGDSVNLAVSGPGRLIRFLESIEELSKSKNQEQRYVGLRTKKEVLNILKDVRGIEASDDSEMRCNGWDISVDGQTADIELLSNLCKNRADLVFNTTQNASMEL